MLRLSVRRAAPRSLVQRRRGLATAPDSQLVLTDPLAVYRGMVATGQIKQDAEQIRALVQIRKLTEELLDYQPPVRMLTLLEALRPTSDPAAKVVPAWPFRRSPLSHLGMDLTPEEAAERQALIVLDDASKSTALVKVLKEAEGLEDLSTPKGFLLTGPPGTGKSLVMDIFFQSLPVPHKVRFHYHSFLLSIYTSVHQALEKQRLENEAEERIANELSEKGEGGYPWSRREEMKAQALTKGWQSVFAGGRSPHDADLNTREFVLAGVARDLIKQHGWLLAFDEVQLVDIAGAGLINRVLSWYWRLGGVVVGTSNRVPEDLYNAGVQRESLSPFLVALAARSPAFELRSALDYRREQRSRDILGAADDRPAGDFGTVEAWKRWGTKARGWFVKGEENEFEEAVRRIVGEEQGAPTELTVYGRRLVVPWAVGGVARFSFAQLCLAALGPADYITIGSNFHTIILTDVPILPLSAKNEARRLISLLDCAYEAKTRLLVFAEDHVDSLFFPDAVATSSLPSPFAEPSPDDITTAGGHDHPFSSDRIYEADSSLPTSRMPVDPAGEIGDSLTEEMMGDVIHDLETPYRPNVSSYDATEDSKAYAKDAARVEQVRAVLKAAREEKAREEQQRKDPHPSASTPAFQSLAIFTGEEERFAFKRAVSRVHEMTSAEFLINSTHTPLDPSFRTWERPSSVTLSSAAVASTPRSAPAQHSMGPAIELTGEEAKLSGVLDPRNLRVRHPEGLPKTEKQVEVTREGGEGRRRGIKVNVLDDEARKAARPPVLKNDHVWGVREDWGKKAGEWGKGASVHDEDTKKRSHE
ncbi:AFG1-like ATPase-domain-containing protein [Leucosporidium creatinivorum]|uniref:AFG1-like ATPase-domain-containing protein n=1 Tax=Leucosporidium creatinivorum TaxID=106004 RepID=A0A1Y2G0W4_9BASI|nr:AFG1-like ATPase-domain-containing protein [Leucosporidium creatinivorum]